MTNDSQYDGYKVVAKLLNTKPLMQALKAISLEENCTFQITSEGIKVTVEYSKFLQANLFVNSQCFEEFKVPEDEVITFSVNLNVTAECLGIFSGLACEMKMLYKGKGSPLVFLMAHNGDCEFTTECSIKTKNYEDPSEYELVEDCPKYNVIILHGQYFYELVLEFDKSAEEVELNISPTEPHFKITTIGVMQSESDFVIAKSSDMIVRFNCQSETSARYKYSHIRMFQKALALSSKVAIKTDASGLLELHFMMKTEKDDSEMYIQYFITPLVDC
ncbi:RAD1 family protein [Megaselia abdita]